MEIYDQAAVTNLARTEHKKIHTEYDETCPICRFWFTDPKAPKIEDSFRLTILDFSK